MKKQKAKRKKIVQWALVYKSSHHVLALYPTKAEASAARRWAHMSTELMIVKNALADYHRVTFKPLYGAAA